MLKAALLTVGALLVVTIGVLSLRDPAPPQEPSRQPQPEEAAPNPTQLVRPPARVAVHAPPAEVEEADFGELDPNTPIDVSELPSALRTNLEAIVPKIRKHVKAFPDEPRISPYAAHALNEYYTHVKSEYDRVREEYNDAVVEELMRRIDDEGVDGGVDLTDRMIESGQLDFAKDHWATSFSSNPQRTVIIKAGTLPYLDSIKEYRESFDWPMIYRDLANYFDG